MSSKKIKSQLPSVLQWRLSGNEVEEGAAAAFAHEEEEECLINTEELYNNLLVFVETSEHLPIAEQICRIQI